MRTEHTFTVPEALETVRRLITDVDRAVACVPGLTIESAGPGEYGGRLRVRAGSTTVTYRGTGRVTSKDGGTTTIELDGQEARGAGTVKGVLTVALESDGASATRVTIGADATVTGRLGELDPTVLADVVQRLLTRFGECVTAAVSDRSTDAGLAETATPIDEVQAPEAGRPTPAIDEAAADAATATTPPAESAEDEDVPSRPAVATPTRSRPYEPPADLLGPEARRSVWPLRPIAPLLAAVAAVGVIVRVLRRRRRNVR